MTLGYSTAYGVAVTHRAEQPLTSLRLSSMHLDAQPICRFRTVCSPAATCNDVASLTPAHRPLTAMSRTAAQILLY